MSHRSLKIAGSLPFGAASRALHAFLVLIEYAKPWAVCFALARFGLSLEGPEHVGVGCMRGLGGLEYLKVSARCLPNSSWLMMSNRDFLQRVEDWNDDKQIVAGMEEDRSYQSVVL